MTTLHTRRSHVRCLVLAAVVTVVGVPGVAAAQPAGHGDVTFTKDIAPILQRSCQRCHRPDSLAPMSLIDYDEVRPWARSIKHRTGLRDQPGTMPPWFIEKDIGIQRFKDDPSLTDEEIRLIAEWVDNGAPKGDEADMPPPVPFIDVDEWEIGEPDLIISSPSVEVAAEAPDWWGAIGETEIGLTEDRYLAALEYKEVTEESRGPRRDTVGGLFVVHHAVVEIHSPADEDGERLSDGWPAHEVGRNADFFDPEAGRLIKAGAKVVFDNLHLHANGADTRAHLNIGLKFHPPGYEPKFKSQTLAFGNGVDLDIEPMDSDQQMEAYFTLPEHTKVTIYEPHMHAPGVRMCLDAIYGVTVETLNCSGYDHSWVRVYTYADDAQPLLPKGTILRLTGYFNNSPSNPNVTDPRNWSGGGNRSVDQMFINLMRGVFLSDEEFEAELSKRRETLNLAEGDTVIGCPLCGDTPQASEVAGGQQQ